MVPYILASMLLISSCCLPKTCVDALPAPPYTAYPPQVAESSAVAGVFNRLRVAHLAPRSSGSGSKPTIADRDQLIIQDETPIPTIPQAKQRQHQEEEGYTTAMPSNNDVGIGVGCASVEASGLPQPAEVLGPMGSSDWVALKAMTSLVAGGAGATNGTALQAEATITSDVVGTFSTVTGDVVMGVRPSLVPRGAEKGAGGRWDFPPSPDPPFLPGPPPYDSPPPTSSPSPSTSGPSPSISCPSPTTSCPSSFAPSNITLVSGNSVVMPPAVMLWILCIWVIPNILRVVISNVWSKVSHCAAISKVRNWVSQRASFKVHNEQSDRQDCEDKDDTPEYDESITSSTTVNSSVDKCPKSSSSLFCKLTQLLT
ncbi:hypothetical protein EDB92DRAFT_1889751 [Lactarius akahatsu]|uniref:Uncharacterized protein n=1 Tax=Lactarius akahatsu TaxID=416441 RepID=A0AAD4Q760_9AGAM|nr:hypothetical protein EDB92DRAFT_1889751 [Lactarius akahatsu]